MNDFLSPLVRRRWTFLFAFVLAFGILFGLSQIIPQYQKTQVYYTVKSIGEAPEGDHRQAAEGAEFIAEGISGWASDLGFQIQVQETADIFLPKFKQKISARQQNRVNVFFSLTLPQDEWQHAEPLTQALLETINSSIDQLNAESTFTFALTDPKISREIRTFPMSWVIVTCIILGFALAFAFLYLSESLRGRVSFFPDVQDTFPGVSLLRIPAQPGKHDATLLEQYILTFDSPRLLGTFPAAERHFSLTEMVNMNIVDDTPILMIKLGETQMHDIQNLASIYGQNIGVIVFER